MAIFNTPVGLLPVTQKILAKLMQSNVWVERIEPRNPADPASGDRIWYAQQTRGNQLVGGFYMLIEPIGKRMAASLHERIQTGKSVMLTNFLHLDDTARDAHRAALLYITFINDEEDLPA
jgi:hypothetical protein